MSALPRQDAFFQPMVDASLNEIVAIETDVYEFPWTFGNFRDSLRAGYSCWECRSGGALVAYAVMMFGVEEAHLLNLSVARAAQGRGVGSQMLDHVLELARHHRAQQMILEVRPSNHVGRALYARYGFQRIGLRRGYYPARSGREDAVVLRLAL